MKNLIRILSVTTLILTASTVPLLAGDACCGEELQAAPAVSATQSATQSATAMPAEQAQKYVCPMHPDVIYDKPGKCPKCGMTLVPVKDEAKSNR